MVLQADGSVSRLNISLDDDSFTSCNFNKSLETRIIVHGWNSNTNSSLYTTTPVEYAKLNKYNVIMVNWLKLSNTFYPATVQYCLKKVAQKIIDFILYAKDNFELSLSSVTLVGHSLGAHTSGLVGRTLIQMNPNNKIANIIGLDAAGPLFGYVSGLINDISPQDILISRLSKGDAEYVTCWHTNSLVAGSNWLPNCHSDIFFDLAVVQLQCIGSLNIGCSHTAAYQYLTFSLSNPTCYKGYPKFSIPSTKSRIYVGEPIDHMRSIFGNYEVWTSLKEPYCN